MDLKTQRNALSLIWSLFDRQNETKACLPFVNQKQSYQPEAEGSPFFSRVAPETEGISSLHLIRFLTDIRVDKSIKAHTIMILRHGRILSSVAFYPYRMDMWNYTFSVSKTIVALAIGMLIEDKGLTLDDRIVDLFQKECSTLARMRLRNLRVRHLLTMTSGISFNEIGSLTCEDWIDGYLESGLKFEPGEQFDYNSMNTYMLSAIVCKQAGVSLSEFLQKRLWEPLEIKSVFWEKCPKGIEKGGWGLYLSPESMAKVGQLLLNEGSWNSLRLVSKEWLAEMTKTQVIVSETFGDFNYGYHLWISKNERLLLFNGMFGQNIVLIPKTGIMLVVTAGNDDNFQKGNLFVLIKKYFDSELCGASALKASLRDVAKLRKLEESLSENDTGTTKKNKGWIGRVWSMLTKNSSPPALPDACGLLDGRRFQFDVKHCRGIGLVPLFLQLFQNNFTKGLNKLVFNIKNKAFHLIVIENDQSFDLVVGFDQAVSQTLRHHGDAYAVTVGGEFKRDEDDNWVLKVRICFLEYPNQRLLRIVLRDKGLSVKMEEMPGRQYITNGMQLVTATGNRLIDIVAERAGNSYVEYLIDSTILPTLWAALIEKE